MRNFQDSIFILTRTNRQIFKAALVYLQAKNVIVSQYLIRVKIVRARRQIWLLILSEFEGIN